MAKDLVCNMEVDPKTAAAKTEYKGQTYYFCAPGCKVAFEKDPEKYIKGQKEAEHKHRVRSLRVKQCRADIIGS